MSLMGLEPRRKRENSRAAAQGGKWDTRRSREEEEASTPKGMDTQIHAELKPCKTACHQLVKRMQPIQG